MKKIIAVVVFSLLLISSVASAADVVITITIPDAYVARLQAAIQGKLHCAEGMTDKACLVDAIKRQIKNLIMSWEREQADKAYVDSYNETYVEPEVQ